jgi:hypothetical protein
MEAFEDDAAGPHVDSEHFRRATSPEGEMRRALTGTPKIISRRAEGEDWEEMGEMRVG